MAIVVGYTAVGVTAAQYDAINDRVKSTRGWMLEGLDHHICFGTEGDLRASARPA